jgi:uncharacterized protein (TIGR00255 family)
MGVRSMTGYGRAVAQADGIRVEVEISSVNRKQLDISISLPRALGGLEAPMQEEIATVLARGRIHVNVIVRAASGHAHARVRFDETLARAYRDIMRAAAHKLKVEDDIGISLIANMPGVLCVEADEEASDRVWPVLQRALRRALTAVDRMRVREGALLARDLELRIDALDKANREIRRLAPAAVTRYRAALKRRLAELQSAPGVDSERLDREALLFADRCDVTEECTRIDSHLRQARALLRGREPAGKALDFLAQELNREINTIASKSSDAEIARRVVKFKTELERLREQAQNIQ